MRGARWLIALLLIQSPILKPLGNAVGFQGMLKMMISLFVRLVTWELISSAKKLFHSLSSWSHKSLILVHPALAMAYPSLSPFTLKGRLAELVTRGLLKISCLRTFTCDVGLVFARPMSHSTKVCFSKTSMLFQNMIRIWISKTRKSFSVVWG
jgi:hypothetical protein